MKIIIDTERINICLAEEGDIDRIMAFENHEENSRFIWQGSYEEHLHEIGSDNILLMTLRGKSDDKVVGFALGEVDRRSNVFELKRIAVSKKGVGYGREAISGIMSYSFNTLKTNRFWLDVYPDHEVGIRLYKSLGMKWEGTLRQSYRSDRGYLDQMIFSILREEYLEESR